MQSRKPRTSVSYNTLKGSNSGKGKCVGLQILNNAWISEAGHGCRSIRFSCFFFNRFNSKLSLRMWHPPKGDFGSHFSSRTTWSRNFPSRPHLGESHLLAYRRLLRYELHQRRGLVMGARHDKRASFSPYALEAEKYPERVHRHTAMRRATNNGKAAKYLSHTHETG